MRELGCSRKGQIEAKRYPDSLERLFELIDLRLVVEPEKLIHLLAMPAEFTNKVGPGDTLWRASI